MKDTTVQKFTMKTPERRQWRICGAFILDLEHISYILKFFQLLAFIHVD